MSIRYGQKVLRLDNGKISSTFSGFNRNAKIKVPSSKSTERPSDSIVMPSIDSSEQKVAMLIFVSDDSSNFLSFTVAGNYTVDWGDGVTENFSSGVSAYHIYDYSTFDVSNETLNSDGYKQAIAIITPQVGANLTSLNFTTKHSSALAANAYPQPIIELYISAPNLTSLTVGSAAPTSTAYPKAVRYINLINAGSVTTFHRQFYSLYNLKKIEINTIGAVTAFSEMFYDCRSLVEVKINAAATTSVTNTSYMFYNCYSLVNAPFFNMVGVTATNHMFYNCYSLETVPLYNTSNVTSFSNMFFSCYNLTTVPLFNTVKVTTMTQLFYDCRNLTTVPLFNTVAVTDMSYMFYNCFALKTIPLLNTASVTTMSNMFYQCYSLVNLPLLNTGLVTSMVSMFVSCQSLATIPLFNTGNVTNMANMFTTCSSLQTIPLLDTSKVTTMYQIFYRCYSLNCLPLIDVTKITGTSAQYMFTDCASLKNLPSLNYSLITDMSYMFSGCNNLSYTPSFSANSVTSFAGAFSSCHGLSSISITNVRYDIDLTNCKLAKNSLETFFANLGTAATGATRTLTLTNNWGAPTPVSLTGTTTAGSTTITMANTTGLTAGMQVTGTNTSLTTGRSVTFTDVGDLVNLTAHGLGDGDEVSFSSITSTTGIVINTIYFVVNSTADNFQVASTAGGAALPLTTNGSGTVKYNSTIVSIVPNTSITMSRPMAGSASQTLAFRLLGTYKAILKGFAITG